LSSREQIAEMEWTRRAQIFLGVGVLTTARTLEIPGGKM